MSSLKQQESQKRILQHLTEAKKLSHASINVGSATVEELNIQKETLQSVEDLLEKNDDVIDQSLRKIRGMTWSGTFYNLYSDVVTTLAPPNLLGGEASVNNGKELEKPRISDTDAAIYQEQASTTANSKDDTEKGEEDQMLDELSHASHVLKQIGITMGQQLDEQNKQLQSVERKTEEVHDKTTAVSIKASQLTQRHSGASARKERYVGTYQFMNVKNFLLLAVVGENLGLTNSADLCTLFRVYLRQETIVGLQNEETGKYVGVTLFGKLSVSGNYFGSQEECYMDLDSGDTGLLFISKNWGAGGWLTDPTAAASGKHSSIDIDDVSVTGNWIPLTEATNNAGDRTNRMIFKAIKCK
jgi:hypothetical protein